MEKFAYLLPVLGCAAMMGVMMWMMMRGGKKGAGTTAQPGQEDDATAQEIAALRAEIAALREQANPPTGRTDRASITSGTT